MDELAYGSLGANRHYAPLGISLVGPPGSDEALLALAPRAMDALD
jgi:Asp-tRNA(Asn)/Glu-tRNA(Gln) amidotransferase A subunit family amidase